MALETYSANNIVYTISRDTDAPVGARPQAVVRMILVDELTGLAPRGEISISTPTPGLAPRTGLEGLAGLAGIPFRVFSELASHDYTVPLTVAVSGYVGFSLPVKIPKTPGFPDVFGAVDLGVIALHRSAIEVYGRAVVSSGTGISPASGATVNMTGLWRTLPPAHVNVPPEPPNIISLQPPLYFDRAAAASQIAGLDFLGAPGPDKQLLADGPAGRSTLRLSDCILLAPADILAIDAGDPDLTEYIAIQSIDKSGADNLPAKVTLVYPLRYTHRRGAIVHKVVFTPAGAPTPLAHDAIAGDVCAFVTAVGSLGAAPLAQTQGGPSPDEFHRLSRFSATCDAQGFFRLPPISRVAQCNLRLHDGVHADIDATVCPDYASGESRFDFVFQ